MEFRITGCRIFSINIHISKNVFSYFHRIYGLPLADKDKFGNAYKVLILTEECGVWFRMNFMYVFRFLHADKINLRKFT